MHVLGGLAASGHRRGGGQQHGRGAAQRRAPQRRAVGPPRQHRRLEARGRRVRQAPGQQLAALGLGHRVQPQPVPRHALGGAAHQAGEVALDQLVLQLAHRRDRRTRIRTGTGTRTHLAFVEGQLDHRAVARLQPQAAAPDVGGDHRLQARGVEALDRLAQRRRPGRGRRRAGMAGRVGARADAGQV
ncbi:MAG: hypothetical protein U1F53_11015 [Burkholderiaceae bacterium]